jgi:hypothetical protein
VFGDSCSCESDFLPSCLIKSCDEARVLLNCERRETLACFKISFKFLGSMNVLEVNNVRTGSKWHVETVTAMLLNLYLLTCF